MVAQARFARIARAVCSEKVASFGTRVLRPEKVMVAQARFARFARAVCSEKVMVNVRVRVIYRHHINANIPYLPR